MTNKITLIAINWIILTYIFHLVLFTYFIALSRNDRHWTMNNVDLGELEMHEKPQQRDEAQIRLREPCHRTGILHVTDGTPICQLWMNFEGKT